MSKIDDLGIGQNLIDEYNIGSSCTQLQNKYGPSHVTISTYLKKHGISVVNRQNEQLGLIKNIFETIDTEEKAYWLGFLYADGYVATNRNRVNLTLKESDKSHIEKFKKFTGTTNKVAYRERLKAYRISICCKKMKEDLIKLGCTPCKSWTINSIPNIPEDLKIHFIRGFFDGDGCISFGNTNKEGKRSVVINIVSNRKMLDAICNFFGEKRNYSKKANSEILMVRWSGKKASELLKLMYENQSICLERKLKRYEIFKNNGFAAWKSDFPSY